MPEFNLNLCFAEWISNKDRRSVHADPQKWRSHGVMVSTQDSESCDPSSNLGGTWQVFPNFCLLLWQPSSFSRYPSEAWICGISGEPAWQGGRDSSVGRALDWRSKGPRFDPGSRQFFGAFNQKKASWRVLLHVVKKRKRRRSKRHRRDSNPRSPVY